METFLESLFYAIGHHNAPIRIVTRLHIILFCKINTGVGFFLDTFFFFFFL